MNDEAYRYSRGATEQTFSEAIARHTPLTPLLEVWSELERETSALWVSIL